MNDSSSSDSDDDIEVPSREECQERIEKFVSVTGTDEVMTMTSSIQLNIGVFLIHFKNSGTVISFRPWRR